jgi:hypothetical protein
MLKPLTPIPAMRRGFRLYPDDSAEDGTATRLLLDMRSFQRRPDLRNPRPWLTGGLAVGTAAVTIRSILHHRGSVGT